MRGPRGNVLRRYARVAAALALILHLAGVSVAAYNLNWAVGDMRQPALAGGTSCPQRARFDVATPGTIHRRWSTVVDISPVTILTADQSPAGRLAEIETAVQRSFAGWTSVPGTLLKPSSLDTLQRTSVQAACSTLDGLNSICFSQNDAAFTPGVLAFTRVVIADLAGEQLSPVTLPSTFVGEILDADVQLRPGDNSVKFATPAVLATNPTAYDLESILTHELGHVFGFSHSAVWRAMMFPFAPPPGQFTGSRPTAQSPDAPLSDDDRTGLRVLYPDPGESTYAGSIRGRILPANPLMLPVSPVGVTGVYPAQVVAIDNGTGALLTATVGGWSCTGAGPVRFDGSYVLERLPVSASQAYQVYVEPLGAPVTPAAILGPSTAICRNAATDPGWPAQYACLVPPLVVPFSARLRPGP